MKLFLASYIKDPNTINKLEEFIGGFKGKTIAYIPTASNGEEGWEKWKTKSGGSWELANGLGAKIEPIVLEDFRNDSVVEKLEGKDILWFAGGMAGYLAYWMRRCSFDIHLPRILDKSIYVGSSAGSIVAGQTLDLAGWDFVDSERGVEDIKPMKLVDFDIYPHFEDSLFEKIKENYKGKKLYLLKNGEEIIVEDGKITVIGEERIIQ